MAGRIRIGPSLPGEMGGRSTCQVAGKALKWAVRDNCACHSLGPDDGKVFFNPVGPINRKGYLLFPAELGGGDLYVLRAGLCFLSAVKLQLARQLPAPSRRSPTTQNHSVHNSQPLIQLSRMHSSGTEGCLVCSNMHFESERAAMFRWVIFLHSSKRSNEMPRRRFRPRAGHTVDLEITTCCAYLGHPTPLGARFPAASNCSASLGLRSVYQSAV
jgi:hypothetical protein